MLLVTPKSVLKMEAPRHSLADAQPSDRVRYTALSQPDGVSIVQELTLGPDTV